MPKVGIIINSCQKLELIPFFHTFYCCRDPLRSLLTFKLLIFYNSSYALFIAHFVISRETNSTYECTDVANTSSDSMSITKRG